MTNKFRLVEVYGSLLNGEEREKTLKGKGVMKEVGKVKRTGWKLSFDRYSKCWEGAVLNFVYTGNQKDVYYTTVYEVDASAYEKVTNREMGEDTGEKWRRGRQVCDNSYRPIQLYSEFGISDIFIILFEGRKKKEANSEDKYVSQVREGIKEAYKEKPTRLKANLKALDRAIKESKTEPT